MRWDGDRATTVHAAAGRYVSSIFDLVHNTGSRTAFVTSTPELSMVRTSWDATNGGSDPYGVDNGRDKFTQFLTLADDDAVADRVVSMLGTTRRR
ncbi:MAG: hypothetical protein R2731_11440 [Nocardioides sp.]